MRRGDIWTVAGGRDYAGKPRPVVIVQDDSFDAAGSITICAFTTDETDAPLFRMPVEPNERNGLRATCRLMADKITTVPKFRVGALTRCQPSCKAGARGMARGDPPGPHGGLAGCLIDLRPAPCSVGMAWPGDLG